LRFLPLGIAPGTPLRKRFPDFEKNGGSQKI
jgi:hypothetical protein